MSCAICLTDSVGLEVRISRPSERMLSLCPCLLTSSVTEALGSLVQEPLRRGHMEYRPLHNVPED